MHPARSLAPDLTRWALSSWRFSVVAALCFGCGASEPGARGPAEPSRPPPPPSSPAVLLRDSGWGRVTLEALALSLELPDSLAWRDAGGRDWRRLEHRESNTVLAVTRFRAPASVAARECAARAGLGLGAAGADDSSQIEARSIEGAHDTHSLLSVRVEPDRPGALRGELEAATAGFRVCAALRLETRVDGDGREAEIARRLALFADGVVPSLAFARVEDRIQKKSDPIGL